MRNQSIAKPFRIGDIAGIFNESLKLGIRNGGCIHVKRCKPFRAQRSLAIDRKVGFLSPDQGRSAGDIHCDAPIIGLSPKG